MKKMKKILALVLTVALLAAAIGGTLAYLQDEDSDVNVMTLGNVYIEQHEYQRADDVKHNAGEPGAGNGVKEGALVPYVQGQGLYPAVPANNLTTDYSAEATDLFFWGDYVYSGTAGNGLWNDEKLSNVMDKMVFVENTGKSDAFFRTIIAFECPEGITIGEPAQGAEIMINRNGSTVYSWEDVGYVTIDDVRYAVVVATYQNALKPNNQSHPSLLQVVMTHHATNEDMELLGDTYEILVLSQAVQAQGFADAETALDTAFGEVKENAKQWFTETLEEPFAIVTIPCADDTLTNADGDVTVLGKNLMIDTTGSKMGLDVGKIPLDTAYQFEPSISAEEVDESEYADWHADFVVSVDKDIPAYGIGLAGYYDAWCSLNNDKWVLLASDEPIKAGTKLRLVEAMGQGSITVSYRELCRYGNDGIGFLCGAKDMSGMPVLGNTVGQIPAGTTLTVELRLYETEAPSPENGNSTNVETGNYITTGTYRYTFE